MLSKNNLKKTIKENQQFVKELLKDYENSGIETAKLFIETYGINVVSRAIAIATTYDIISSAEISALSTEEVINEKIEGGKK